MFPLCSGPDRVTQPGTLVKRGRQSAPDRTVGARLRGLRRTVCPPSQFRRGVRLESVATGNGDSKMREITGALAALALLGGQAAAAADLDFGDGRVRHSGA